ncbi:MAG: RibD family protein [Candidatus Hodarchaeales archaeon]|jgi:riboflavin-specific deaminase-like protein
MIIDKTIFKRPHVVLSAAMSLDGYISTISEDSKLSNSEDWARVHNLRAHSDAIMVGSGTIRSDDSKLVVDREYVSQKPYFSPIRIVVSSTGNIPLNARVITYFPNIPTIIAISSKCSQERRQKLEERGCKIIESGDGPLIDLPQLLHILHTEYTINNLMLEGGSRLNGEMLFHQLIDEIHLAIAPVICGKGIPFFSLPNPLHRFSESPFFSIISHEQIGDMILLKISPQYKQRQIT